MNGVLAPELETDRLLLRGWRDSDHEAHAAMCADPEVMRFIGGPIDRDQSWRAMALMAGHWVLRGYGNWVVVRRRDDTFLGRVGLWNPEGWPGLEVGWTLVRGAWGQGYATEAARASIDWAWTDFGAQSLISLIDPGNSASIGVANRLGMRRVGGYELWSRPVTVFGIDRES